MSIAAVSVQSGASAQNAAQIERAASDATRRAGSGEGVTIEFSPPSARGTSPIGQLGGGLMDTLRGLEQTRAAKRDAMSGMGTGPASAVDAAKRELLAGPASIRPASGTEMAQAATKSGGVDEAVGAMTRSFDYAIETQLIVKTGSQLSSSASSLMRGQ